jgi:hypothetical protein
MVLERDEKVLIITRRLFLGDPRRHFVGIVERCAQGAVRVRGYAFVYDTAKGGFVKRKSQRTHVFPLDSHILVFVLPYDVDIAAVRCEAAQDAALVVTDGKHTRIDISEFNV